MKPSTYTFRLIIHVILIGVCVEGFKLLNIRCLFRTIGLGTCPSCGLTRAIYAAIHLRFQDALEYHSLFYFAVAFPVLLSFRREDVGETSWFVIKLAEVMLGIAFLLRWLIVRLE